MDDPVADIEGVIHDLTQSHPSVQRATIARYFTANASFTHPFCRTGSFEGSRNLIQAIFRWYKIMSPKIDLTVSSIAYDRQNLVLYVNISQVFRIWFIPFYVAPVTLTTVLHLMLNRGDGKYYIASQEDLYQVDQFVKFFAPGGWMLVWVWQIVTTLVCAVLALAFWPISWWEEHGEEVQQTERRKVNGVVNKVFEKVVGIEREGNMMTAPAVQQR